MADDAETKNIARLDFDVKNAINNLDIIDKKLKSIAESSNLYAKQIGKNIGSSFDFSKVLNVDSFSKQLSQVTNITEAKAKNLVYNIMKNEQDITAKAKIEQEKRQTAIVQSNVKQLQSEATTADKIKVIVAEKEAYKEKKAYASALKQEEYNNRVEKSTKTLYDRILNYANTYLIYQGFNMLKRGISEVVDEMVNLESSMVQIDRVLNESSLNIDDYRDKLMQTAYDYANSMENVSDIALRLAQAGFDSNETLKLTEKTLLALNTAELNATQATDDMVAVMAQWGYMTGDANKEAEQYGAIIDKINKVADNFPTTSADIMNALKKVSSAFNLAGADIDETIATIVAAEKASQRGGKVIGTALSNIVQQIKAEGKLDLAEQLGLNFFKDDAKTEFKPIMEIFQEMSNRMSALKSQGKESSVEMQKLLELFTVFRRNIGASLLGQMEGGEKSTYMQVYETSLNSIGYSLQENAKYMATAKAAQEQFNVSVLDLKTQVWDNGVEDVYKSMLIFGKELVDNIGLLVDKFGGIPVVVGTVTLAFSLLNKNMRVAKLDMKDMTIQLDGYVAKFKEFVEKTYRKRELPKAIQETATISNVSFGSMIASITAYDAATMRATMKTIALKAATIGLNLAATAAATAGMMLLVSIVQELINKEAAAIQLQESSIQSTEKQISKREEEITNLQELIKSYDKLAEKKQRTPDETMQLYEIQVKIKDILGEQADTIDLINGKYEKQKQKISEITQKEQEKLLNDKKKLMEQKEYAGVNVALPSFVQSQFGDKNYEKNIKEYGGTGLYNGSLKETLENSTIEEAIELFTKWEENLRSVQGESQELANTYNWVNETLNKLNETVKDGDAATEDYYKTLASVEIEKLFPEGSIKNAEHYNSVLKSLKDIAKDTTGDMKIYQEALVELFIGKFPQFAQETQNVAEQVKGVAEANDYVVSKLEGLSQQYSILERTQNELNQTGSVTISTFKNLVDNNLLDYLNVVNGQLVVNTDSMAAMAEETKVSAIESLKAAASEDIHKLALGKEADMSVTAKNAIANFGNSASTAGGKAKTAAAAILGLASALAQVAAANKDLAGENNVSDFSAKAAAISGAYQSAARKISSISISSAGGSSRSSGGGSRSGSSGRSGSRSTSSYDKAEQKKKERQEKEQEKQNKAYEKRLNKFTQTLEKMENKEEEWVKKQKELGLLSNSDMLYVTKNRIQEYQKYLDKIKKATWLNKEDRKKMIQEYTQKLKDAELDYFNYLKGKLDDQIKAIEDARDKRVEVLEKQTNKEKELIEKAANARIEALKKVSDARDRDREKEDYQRNRKEILDEIKYWQQRTGREAVENLAEARKKLEELDRNWKEKTEDWNTDDLIKSIEDERDARTQALDARLEDEKREIENNAQMEINALQKVYDAKVKAFSNSNKIIYDNSVISAKNLYKAYKTNFVNPLSSELKKINKNVKISKGELGGVYTAKKGDTLESIAKSIAKKTGKKTSTIIKKIKEANKSLKNTKKTKKIKKGTKINIPKFHEGGIVGGNKEAYALLKPNEVVLRPEWAASLNRMMKYFDNNINNQRNPINTGNNIQIEGNLVNIQANVRNQSDIDAIGKKVEKILKDKFNIRK